MSFLEKLQKGMQNGQDQETPAQNPEIASIQNVEEDNPQEGTAVFASFRSADKRIEESESAVKKTRPRGRPKRLITAENLEEMTSGQANQPEKNSIMETQDHPQKTMLNKKTAETENSAENEWLNGEGQLTVNVYQTDNDLVLQSAIAGIKVEDLDVLIEDDVITIKGNRANPIEEDGDYFIEECYFGPFSRKVILPVDVDSSRADAAMKEGILTIRIPKIQREKKKKLTIKE